MDELNKNAEVPENDKADHQQATIFNELGNQSKYKQNVNQGRYWLFMIAGYWSVYGFSQFHKLQEYNVYLIFKQNAWYVLAIYLVISLVFLTTAFWSRKKASLSFLAALLFYTGISAWQISSTGFILQENIIRMLVIIILLKGYKDARSYEEITNTFGGQPYKQEA